MFAGFGGASFTLTDALDRDRAFPEFEAPTPYTLSMADILNTMLTADPYQVEYFVGLMDAYRLSIWDKPFNQEFFNALGEGFKQWG